MSCPVPVQDCNNFIDYSAIIINDERILPFQFQLDPDLSVLNPEPGENQRFCYRVTGVGEDNSTYVDLSHWVLSLCPNITLDQIVNVEVTIGGIPQVITDENVELFIPPASDPTTGCPGLKFDFGIAKVLGAPGSTGLFCFELTSLFPVGPVNVCVKGGQVDSSALAICGPVCTETCNTVASQLINVCVPITITPDVCVGPTSTTCCGPAVVSTTPCGGVPGGTCTFTVSQLICVEVPVNFSATAVPGETFVDCGGAAEGQCACPVDNDDTEIVRQ